VVVVIQHKAGLEEVQTQNRARGNNNQVTSGSLQQYPVADAAASYRRTSDRVAATVRRTANPTPSAHAPARQPAATGDRL